MTRLRMQDDRGSAIIAAIGLMFVVVAIVMVLVSITTGTRDRAQQRTERVLGRNPVDAGIMAYMGALDGYEAGEHTGFVFEKPAMDLLAADGYTLVANSSLPAGMRVVDASVPANARYTARKLTSDGALGGGTVYSFWQMYALVPPTYATGVGARVVAYFRGWIQDQRGAVVGQPEMVRAELRPGRFSDYEVIADGPIIFGDGATINGRVHSNGIGGSRNGLVNDTLMGGHMIKTVGGACGSAGAIYSTAKGSISACGGQSKPDTNNPISMLRVRHLVDLIRGARPGKPTGLCGDTSHVRIVCFNRVGTVGGVYQARLTAGGLVVENPTSCHGGGCAASVPSTRGAVVVFDRGVHLHCGGVSACNLGSGQRLTIVAAADADTNYNQTIGAHSIHIHDSIGAGGAASASLGLVAQGDIIMEIDPADPWAAALGRCPRYLNAAVTAAGGGVTIPGQWLTLSVEPGATVPSCGGVSFTGALAGHYMPSLNLDWGNGMRTGFDSRAYRYDGRYYDNPPPLYPTTGPWQLTAYRDADLGCFNQSGQLQTTRPGCA